MVTRVCSIENCGRPIKARGWCEPHYTRWRAHGAPTAGRAIKGAGRDFLLSLIGKHGPDCIVWPFATRADGRGTLWFDGRQELAHRVVCRLAHGKAPAAGDEAAHSCGNGHGGCVNPDHVRWATHQVNVDDMLDHETRQYGQKNPSSILTRAAAEQIRTSRGVSQRALADKFGVSKSTIWKIQRGETWAARHDD